jgi:hypothetical protein
MPLGSIALRMLGFIFAFYRFSLLKHASLVERMVHTATGDDAIHVAIVPAQRNAANTVRALDCAYTAFIGQGVVRQPIDEVFGSPNYVLYFVPVAPYYFDMGRSFLSSVVGTQYNNISLLSTLLPTRFKRSIPAWVSHENELHMPGRVPALFCSQLGLMLCTVIGIPHSIDPAACSPGELERIVIMRAFPLDDSTHAV